MFTISEQNKALRRGETLQIDFKALFPANFRIPMVTGVKLNNAQICPESGRANENNQNFDGGPRCAEFKMIGNGTGGRWDGVLTVYPPYPRRGIRVDVELDQTAWALGVNIDSLLQFIPQISF